MSDRVKRVLFAVGFLLLAGGIAFAMYWVFFRGGILSSPPSGGGMITPPGGTGSLPPSTPAGDRTNGGGTGSPGTGSGSSPGTIGTTPGTTDRAVPQTILLRDGVTLFASLSTDGRSARYYNPEDGLFYRVDADGVSTPLSDDAFPTVETVTWANDSDQAILTFPDGRKVQYDFRNDRQHTIPTHWEDFAFSPDDRQIVSKSVASSPDARYLTISNADGSNPTAIEPLGENEDLVFPVWTPNNQIVAYALVGNAQGLDRQEVLMVGRHHENFRALQVEGRGFLPLWSPDGATVLYSVWSSTSGYRPELWVSGGSASTMNQNRTKLGIRTWADKCVWRDSFVIYCAVPDTLPTGAGLQRDAFANLTDSFLKIDLRTGAQTTLGRPEGARSVQHLAVTTDGRALLFTDAQSGRLYRFNLP